MTAEERLKKRYEADEMGEGEAPPDYVRVTRRGEVNLSPEDVDLIANLVVERLLSKYKDGDA